MSVQAGRSYSRLNGYQEAALGVRRARRAVVFLAAGFLAARAGDLALGLAGLLAAGFLGGMMLLSAL